MNKFFGDSLTGTNTNKDRGFRHGHLIFSRFRLIA